MPSHPARAHEPPATRHLQGSDDPFVNPGDSKALQPEQGMQLIAPMMMIGNDTAEYDLKRRPTRILATLTTESVRQAYDALVLRKGHFDDARDYLPEQASHNELPAPSEINLAQSDVGSAKPIWDLSALCKG
ncbi:hypothetical protein EK21DRAFT_112695 [Setomelanomma holmii]|uniref:Uncharacterized protein n=1 Tax=Setomelanomma holmii TaxID=210430 RepID=A0A9P4LN84_9PLEO|nr:hypothetical protein EK21DRAFT_112695 [Setomelanomma holmii]